MVTNLLNKKAASRFELSECELDVEKTRLDIEDAKQKCRESAALVLEADGQIRARTILAPHGGVVVKVYKKLYETVTPTQPVYRVVDVGQVRVTGYLDVEDCWKVRVGREVLIAPEIGGSDHPIERETFPGRVVYVDSEIDPKTNTCRVVAEAKNRDGLLKAGLEGRMEILPASAAAPPASVGALSPPGGRRPRAPDGGARVTGDRRAEPPGHEAPQRPDRASGGASS
jgi:multidrug efflux pump subunit AcrA (membrane-fusion protein)